MSIFQGLTEGTNNFFKRFRDFQFSPSHPLDLPVTDGNLNND